MRIAAIDVGTNTALLFIAEVDTFGRMIPLHDEERFVRLGEGVDADRRLKPDAMNRVLAALDDYAQIIREYEVEAVTIAGTSASRDAVNGPEFAEMVFERIGYPYEIIPGDEEAFWSFQGALSARPDLDDAVVLDVGGGSSELVWDGGRTKSSLDVGAVRLTERFFSSQPPSSDEVSKASAFIQELLDSIGPPAGLPLIGAAGTVRTLARVIHPAEPEKILLASEVSAFTRRLLQLSPGETLAINPALMNGRADVIAAGALIVDSVVRHLRVNELTPSPNGLRQGLVLRCFRGC